VDYRPPKAVGSLNTDWLLIRCHYASLCASILKHFYSQGFLQNQNSNSISDLEDRLDTWVRSLPSELQLIDSEATDCSAMTSQDRRTKLCILFQYHEALLAIHTRRKSEKPLNMADSDKRLISSDQKRATSVKKLLAVCNQITASDVLSYPQVEPLSTVERIS
jgi:hypothetical protein